MYKYMKNNNDQQHKMFIYKSNVYHIDINNSYAEINKLNVVMQSLPLTTGGQ